ncbi:MAG: glycosyltransferase family 9 protein [bacterium]
MKSLIVEVLNKLFGIKESNLKSLPLIKSVFVVRQHNQFGDLLASSALFVAIKEKYPNSKLTVLVSPQNYYAVTKNKYIDTVFIFNKKKLFNPFYLSKLINILKQKYDLAIIPSTVSLSFTSSLLGRLSNSKIRIGASELNGIKNKYSAFFDIRVPLDWRLYPDQHVADFGLEIVRNFGITTTKFAPVISFDKDDLNFALSFLKSITKTQYNYIVGLHVGAGKPKNRWSLDKYINVIKNLIEKYKTMVYCTGSSSDKTEIDYIKNNLGYNIGYCIDKKIPELAAIISVSDLFITNDTGVMHVAGSTNTPQISIFGPTNPYNWAPVGKNKYICKTQSELIDDVTVEEVLILCEKLLGKK